MELWSALLVFVSPAEVARLFWKTNEAAILSENFASYSILSRIFSLFDLFHTYAFVLVVGDVICVSSG